MKACLLLFWVRQIERRTRFDVIDVPVLAMPFPTHSRLELLLNVLYVGIQGAPEHVQSAGAFCWNYSTFGAS